MPVRQMLLLAGALGLAACSDGAGPDSTPMGFAGTLNGMPWLSDTAVSVAFASTTDTTIYISGVREITADSSQEITLVLHGLTPGQFAITDSAGHAYAELADFRDHSALPQSQVVFHSLASRPGSIRISSVNRSDSTVAGTFAFESATDTGTSSHRFLAGHFKLHFTLQPVYTAVPAR